MTGFFNVLRQELKKSGVSVTVIYPGLVKTEFPERMILPNGSLQGPSGRWIRRASMRIRTMMGW